MRALKFSKLYLLSASERRALSVSFPTSRVVIRGANGAGKSAVLKSLYDTFGAEPHKIDQSWKSAGVSSAVEFQLGGASYVAVKTLGVYALFNSAGELLFQGKSKVKEWGPALASFFSFHLEMNDRQGNAVVPPPAYIFAPFYVDQDKGWNAPWSSFKDFYLKNSPTTLAEYHSGLRPDAYYTSRAEQERARSQLNDLEHSRAALREALENVRSISEGAGITYDVEVFQDEISDLIAETAVLHEAQKKYRNALAEAHEEQHVWTAERDLLAATLAELKGEFAATADWPDEVECPTCGQHYSHSLADRFSLIADETVLAEGLRHAEVKLAELQSRIGKERGRLEEITASLERMDGILARKQEDISFKDVVVAEGKTEAAKIIGASLDSKEEEALRLFRVIEEQRVIMNDALDPKRIRELNADFRSNLIRFADMLDVRLENPERQRVSAVKVARGSEGPRGLLAYYYAFLRTQSKFGTSVFCPIVLDAPNQQGQDDIHLPKMLEFIIENAPQHSQVIVATENFDVGDRLGVVVHDVGVSRHQVLDEAQYDAVADLFAPFQRALLEVAPESA